MNFLKEKGFTYGAVIGCFLLLALGLANIRGQVLPVSVPVQAKPILIDAGHGAPDGGAVSVTGTLESEINLSIARKLQCILTLCGLDTVMTRTDENGIFDADCGTIAQKKVSDIHNRVKIVNAHPDGLLVSIHQNYFSDGKYHGAQVFSGKQEESARFAEEMQEVLRIALEPENHREKKTANGVYLLEHIQNTGILIECGFLSNGAEAGKLDTEAYQQTLAMSNCTGIHRYLQGESSL